MILAGLSELSGQCFVTGVDEEVQWWKLALAVWVTGPLAEAPLVGPQSCADARPLVGSLLHVD